MARVRTVSPILICATTLSLTAGHGRLPMDLRAKNWFYGIQVLGMAQKQMLMRHMTMIVLQLSVKATASRSAMPVSFDHKLLLDLTKDTYIFQRRL